MLSRMKETFTDESPRVVLNRQNLDQLRRASGIRSEARLAEILGVSTTTLWRISNDKVSPSSAFIARALTAFPHTDFSVLFDVEQPTSAGTAPAAVA